VLFRRETILHCPRDDRRLERVRLGDADIHQCQDCRGRFIDHGEMFAALGAHADPSFWDRPECTAAVADSNIVCARCRGPMLLTTLQTGGGGPYRAHNERVEIDRCTRCQGIWLDPGESEKLVVIGQWMIASIEAERSRAEAELARMSAPDFSAETPLTALARFLAKLFA
jgi:Zn-finger nucleic acid-binding protein